MKIDDFGFTLKDGRTAIIRSPKDEDIQGTLDYLYKSAGETEFILRYPEECAKYTAEAEKALFDRMSDSDNETMLVCIVDGVVAGNCQVTWSKNIKTKHRATVAIALCKDYWNLGIGSRFFQELIRIAEANEDITQMELDFVEGNTRARALYEKFGFKICGVKPNAIKLKDGTMLAEYSMIRKVKR